MCYNFFVMDSKGRELHAKAAKAREEGKFLESLDFNDQALFAYDADNDTLGFAEDIACRSITLRVYANLIDSKRILTLAKYEMIGSVSVATESGDKKALAIPLYNLAQLQEDLGELSEAVTSYKEAVSHMETNPPEMHGRPSILANMKVHMATCEYKSGDTSALNRAIQALHDLEKAGEPNKYNKDVWVSGGYLRLADMLRKADTAKAKEYLQKAKEIIDANPELILRKRQWEKLAAIVK